MTVDQEFMRRAIEIARRHPQAPYGAVIVDTGSTDGTPEVVQRHFEARDIPGELHERPWRSYPRWVRSNENCERQWQGGGVWRCEW